MKQQRTRKKKPAGMVLGALGPRGQLNPQPRPTPMQQANSCLKSPRKTTRTHCPPSVGVVGKKEETQLPMAFKKEGIRGVRRSPDQQLHHEGRIINRKPER